MAEKIEANKIDIYVYKFPKKKVIVILFFLFFFNDTENIK